MTWKVGRLVRGEPVLNQPWADGVKRGCPACLGKRYHTDEEWKQYHSKAGTGIEARLAPQK
jgi:hypothetical protein